MYKDILKNHFPPSEGGFVSFGPLYKERFSLRDLERKKRVFKMLCRYFFNRFIKREDTVVDLGCGYGEFINNIDCREKYAVDLISVAKQTLNSDVRFFEGQVYDLPFLKDATVDVVFMSNLLEHLVSKHDILKTLIEALRVLKPGGRVLILGPNIRYCFNEYWDFFDHHIPLSDRSIAEALVLTGFKPDLVLKKFVPYTVKSYYPKNSFILFLYLHLPVLWIFFGKQMFICAHKPKK